MKKLFSSLIAATIIAAALSAPPAAGQGYSVQERFTLVKANVVGSDQSGSFVAANTTKVYGGDYIFAQTCTSGGVNLLILGPDGQTYLTSITKVAGDTTTGTEIHIGTFSVVAAQLNSGTGCNAVLTRVPG